MPFRATTEDLIRGLSHPARSVRDVAQRRLAERGAEAVGPLVDLLGDAGAPAPARRHALWALDAIDGGVAGRDAILAAVRDPDASVRRQAIRQLGTRRVREATEALLGRLADDDASVRFQAATALGRIGDPEAVPALIEALDEPDAFARYAAFTALNRIGRADPTAWAALVAGLGHPKATVREGVGLALRETYDERLVAALAGFARDAGRSDESRAAALGLLAGVARRRPAWKGEWWAYHPVLGTPPAKTGEWAGTRTVRAALRGALKADDPTVRRAAATAVREARDVDAAPALRDLYRTEADREVVKEVLAALGALKDKEAGGLIRAILEVAGPAPRTGRRGGGGRGADRRCRRRRGAAEVRRVLLRGRGAAGPGRPRAGNHQGHRRRPAAAVHGRVEGRRRPPGRVIRPGPRRR